MRNDEQGISAIVILLGLTLGLASCAPTGTGNPQVHLEFASYTAKNLLLDWLIPSAYATVNDVTFCFKRLRFKIDSSGTGSGGNIDLELGEVTVSALTTQSLTTVSVPVGTYKAIEFDLEPECASGYSLQASLDTGTPQTADSIMIKFEGTFAASKAEHTLSMSLQRITDNIDKAKADGSDLAYWAELSSGTF